MPSPIAVHLPGSSETVRCSSVRKMRNSSDSASAGSGTAPAFSNSVPLWTSSVASPPSSRIMLGPSSPGQSSARSVHHQYSSRVSPFQAKTGTPCGSSGVPFGPMTTAAAAWSWVEKMLQETQRTSAPSEVSVSISTAVWIVMCSEPMIFAPLSGCESANSSRVFIRPGISCSARRISLRPNSARPRSATLKSNAVPVVTVMSGGSPGIDYVSCAGGREQALVLLLLPAHPLGAGRYALRALDGGHEPVVDRLAQLGFLAQSLGERDLGE